MRAISVIGMRNTRHLLAVGAVLLASTACGSDSDPTSEAEPTSDGVAADDGQTTNGGYSGSPDAVPCDLLTIEEIESQNGREVLDGPTASSRGSTEVCTWEIGPTVMGGRGPELEVTFNAEADESSCERIVQSVDGNNRLQWIDGVGEMAYRDVTYGTATAVLDGCRSLSVDDRWGGSVEAAEALLRIAFDRATSG